MIGLGNGKRRDHPSPVGAPQTFLIFWMCGMLPDTFVHSRPCHVHQLSLKDRLAFIRGIDIRHDPPPAPVICLLPSRRSLLNSTLEPRPTSRFALRWRSGLRTPTGRSPAPPWASTSALKVPVTYVSMKLDNAIASLRCLQAKERKGSHFFTEFRAGLATFFAMAYIISVNCTSPRYVAKKPQLTGPSGHRIRQRW